MAPFSCQIGKTVHILYVDIDTLRADHVGFDGFSRLTPPHLDQLAESCVIFERCSAMSRNPSAVDPLRTVLAEGGPRHTRGQLAAYLERLRATGRSQLAARLALAHPREHAGERSA